MAQFTGFTCDSCGDVVAEETRTKKTIRLEGPVTEAERTYDLCAKCAPTAEALAEEGGWRQIRRRKAATPTTQGTTPPPADTAT